MSKKTATKDAKIIKPKKTKAKKVSKKKVVTEEVLVEEPTEVVEVVEDVVDVPVSKVTSPETVMTMFDDILSDLEKEIAKVKESKTHGIKFLRSVNKNIKSLRGKVTTVFKQKRKIKRTSTKSNSGFLKPVKVSKEMAKFSGWNPDELHSRVDVTKALCKYIKDNDLQDPSDRRIIKPDSNLSKLLDYKNKKEPLTYFRIQSCLKEHFPKD